MRIFTLSDDRGRVVAILGGGDHAKYAVRMFPRPNHHVHEIHLPPEAAKLTPHEIHKRLKVSGAGKAPTFS
jgi:hypothetical protein